jgi:hypothetical protein
MAVRVNGCPRKPTLRRLLLSTALLSAPNLGKVDQLISCLATKVIRSSLPTDRSAVMPRVAQAGWQPADHRERGQILGLDSSPVEPN